MKGRVCEVSLGQKGGSSYGKDGREMSNNFSNPVTSQILWPPGSGFSFVLIVYATISRSMKSSYHYFLHDNCIYYFIDLSSALCYLLLFPV